MAQNERTEPSLVPLSGHPESQHTSKHHTWISTWTQKLSWPCWKKKNIAEVKQFGGGQGLDAEKLAELGSSKDGDKAFIQGKIKKTKLLYRALSN